MSFDTRRVDQHVYHQAPVDETLPDAPGRSFGHKLDWTRHCTFCRADPVLRVLDLYCGEKNWSAPATDRGHTVLTVDFDPSYSPDVVADVLELPASYIVERLGGPPDVVLASPPCQGFTIAQMGRNWTRPHAKGVANRYPHLLADTEPRTPKAALGLALAARTLALVDELQPSWWLMENPVGKLRKLEVVGGVPRRTVTYCRYGRPMRKPTDLWGFPPPSVRFEPPCDAVNGEVVVRGPTEWRLSRSTGKPCHESAPRGSATGTQGRKRLESTAVPYALAFDVIVAAERDVRDGRAGEYVGQAAFADLR